MWLSAVSAVFLVSPVIFALAFLGMLLVLISHSMLYTTIFFLELTPLFELLQPFTTFYLYISYPFLFVAACC